MAISIYLVIMIVGMILLMIVLFMGGGHDIGDMDTDTDIDHGGLEAVHGPSAFSLPVILSVVTAFGAFGVIFEETGFNTLQVPALAMVLAIVIGVATFLAMYKMFKATQSTTKLHLDELVGMRGTISVPITEGGEGQVILTPQGRGRVLVAATADDDIERDEIVTCIELIGNVMKVKRIGPKKATEKKESKYKRPEVK